MRLCFKVVLTVAQTAVAIALIAANGSVFRVDIGPLDSYHAPPNLPIGVVRFVEANLPAAPVVAPVYVLLGGRDRANTQ
jgi:hypothetical protein